LNNGFESLTDKLWMLAIKYLELIVGREVMFKEMREYIEQIKQAIEWEGLEVTKDIIESYEFPLVKAHMNLLWLWNNVQSSFKNILTKAFKVTMRYKWDLPIQVEVVTKDFKVWHTYITCELHDEKNDLSI